MNYSDNQRTALRNCFKEEFNMNHITLDMMTIVDDLDEKSLDNYIISKFYANYNTVEEVEEVFQKYLSDEELIQIVSDVLAGYSKSLEEQGYAR